jgi:hypothetical protein
MSKPVSDNPLFREEAAAGGRVKEGGGEGERERTDRGEEDMVVIIRDSFEDCGAEMFEMSNLEDIKFANEEGREGKRRSFLEGERKTELIY